MILPYSVWKPLWDLKGQILEDWRNGLISYEAYARMTDKLMKRYYQLLEETEAESIAAPKAA